MNKRMDLVKRPITICAIVKTWLCQRSGIWPMYNVTRRQRPMRALITFKLQRNLHATMRRSRLLSYSLGMGTGDRFICDTGLSIAVNQSKTGPPSTRFGFLCMHRVPGGVIKLSAPTFSLASQCLPSATIKQPFQNLSSLVPCPRSLCSEAF